MKASGQIWRFAFILLLYFAIRECDSVKVLGNKYVLGNNYLYLRSANQNCSIAGRIMYPYGPECADEELSKDLHRSSKIDLGFNLTFMGHSFDKIWVNQHGFVSFQESFYGTTISPDDWPQPKYPYVDDPVFIAPLYAQTDLAGDKIDDLNSVKYGRVLYKVIHRMDLPPVHTEEEKFIYEMSMRILNEAQAEIRDAVPSGEDFIATHAVIATWKSLSFAGNSLQDLDLRPRNTFQLGLFSDTYQTFAIFNYDKIEWYASTTLGGNPETGTGGKAAKIGFNRGNGTLWYGVKPFSENAQLIQDIENHTNVNRPGRFIYRVDEWIQPGGCFNIDNHEEKKLHIWPRYANMLGGQEVNVTGPCFHGHPYFYCKWGDGLDAPITVGENLRHGDHITKIRGRCIQPLLYYNGRINLSISFDSINFDWKAEYTIVDPLRYPAKVELVNIKDWHLRDPPARLVLKWDRHELSYAESDPVNIELWGYYEDSYGPHWDLLQLIATNKSNKGSYGFDVAPNRARSQLMARIYKLGAIKVSLFDSLLDTSTFDFTAKHIWSALHPIGWWRNDEMKFYYDKSSYLFGSSRGRNWAEDQCRWWHQYRKHDRYWMDELEICPPTLNFAIGDMGVWAPDPQCNMYGSQVNELNCLQHFEAVHCVITLSNTVDGAGNRCCYGKNGNLLYTNDTISGSTPDRYHLLGMPPYNIAGRVPALSHYFNDIVPYYLCCRWGDVCETYLYLRQTKDAKGYKEPRPAVAYGDPHFMTFDGKDYTFNGKGEFYLFKSKQHNFQLQARFEQPPNATFCILSSKGQINATRITAIAAGQDDSDIVEVRTRLYPLQTKILNCDVLINGKTYYFNYTEEKVQIFKNVFVISPLTDKSQSNITIMFNSSGVGVQVACYHGLIHVRVSAPHSMFKDTAGLFGYWNNITADDFLSPDGSSSQLTLKPDLLYQRFGMAWRLKDESESLFSYTGSWNFDTFHDEKPIIREWQRFRPWFTHHEIPFPSNVSFTKEDMMRECEGDEQCMFDVASMGSLEIGVATKNAHRYYRILHESMKAVNSCGIYLMKGGVRKTDKGNYLAGSTLTLSCEKGYMLWGWPHLYCNWNGTWLPTNGQWLSQFRDWPYCEHYHITAIRWTSIGISSLWVSFIALALIYECVLRKKGKDAVFGNNEEPYPVPTDDDEPKVFDNIDNQSELHGFDTITRKKSVKTNRKFSKNQSTVNEETTRLKERDLSRDFSDSEYKPVDDLSLPAIVIQVPYDPANNQKNFVKNDSRPKIEETKRAPSRNNSEANTISSKKSNK